MNSRLINKLVRIPRVVVHPEFRGLGLGSRIAKHLTKYALEHWDIKGYKPILVEVIASMTEYHKFFEMAGFINLGFTEGKSTIFRPRYGKGTWQPRPNAENYKFFGPLGPKPYLVFPLTHEAISLVAGAVNGFDNRKIESRKSLNPDILEFKDVSVNYVSQPRDTIRSKKVKTVFGVDSNQMSSPVLRNFNLTIEPGEVVLATGASGSGKSTLLKLLMGASRTVSQGMTVRGAVPKLYKKDFAVLAPDWSARLPLINQVGDTLDESIALLNSVGLAEAHLYLKTPVQISEGQRYRFSIARLCNSRKPIWIADEFTSTLDPYTAAVVAKGLRKEAAKVGATVLLAAPHIDNFVESLLPTKIVRLHWGGVADVHGICLRTEKIDRTLKVTIRNTTKNDLSEIRLTVNELHGKSHELAFFTALRKHAKEESIFDITGLLSKGTTLRLTTNEGVGDISYLNTFL